MRILATIFSAILALIAIPFFTLAACNLAIETAVLDRSTYDDVLEDEVIFQNILAAALPAISSAPEGEINFEGRDESPVDIQELALALENKPDVWETVTNLLIPPQWLQNTITQVVDVLFGIIDGTLSVIQQEVDFTEVRSRFTGTQATEAATLIITEAPICTENQLEDLRTFFIGSGGTIPICNPQTTDLQARSIDVIVLWFNFVAQELQADTITFSDLFDVSRDDAREFELVVNLQQQGRLLAYLCPMALLALIVIFTVRSLGSFGRWVGGVSIAVGVLMLLLVLALQILAFGVVSDVINAGASSAEVFFGRLVSALVRSAFAKSSANLLLQSGIFVGFGFFWIALAWYASRNQDEQGSLVLITEDGEVISTATQQRIASIDKPEKSD